MKNKNIPQLRFPEFTNCGEWEENKLGKIASKIGDGIHSTPVYSDTSNVYFINGNNIENGKIVFSETTKRVDEGDVQNHIRLLSGRSLLLSINGTIGNLAYYNNENIVLGKSVCYINIKEENVKEFLYYILDSSRVNKYFTLELTGSTIKNLSLNSIKLTPINLPSILEQQKIADCLSSLDNLINAQSEKGEKLKAHKKGLLQKLFPQEGQNLPEFRFPEFRDCGEWEEKKLGDNFLIQMCKRIMKNETSQTGEIPFYKIGTIGENPDAFISKELYLTYKKLYNFPQEGEVLITCSGTVGKCISFDGKDAYYQDSNIVWLRDISSSILNKFIFYIIKEYDWSALSSTTITRIYTNDLKSIMLKIPNSIPEQQKIADCLSSLDELIDKHSQKLELLKVHKKGLMQGLFPCE